MLLVPMHVGIKIKKFILLTLISILGFGCSENTTAVKPTYYQKAYIPGEKEFLSANNQIVWKSYYSAFNNYKKAARQGYTEAKIKLALMFLLDIGVEENLFKRKYLAKQLLESAKEEGSYRADYIMKSLKVDKYVCLAGLCY